jgi:acetyl-CoA synthetase
VLTSVRLPHDYGVRANPTDCENARARFRWSDVPALREGMGPTSCNIADAAIDRHAAGPAAGRTAFRFVSDKGWDGAIAT